MYEIGYRRQEPDDAGRRMGPRCRSPLAARPLLALLLGPALACGAASPAEPANPNANARARAVLKYFQELDLLAAGLQELKDAGVAVLWRPFHEMNNNTQELLAHPWIVNREDLPSR